MKYRLRKAMPGFPAGTIFEHRERSEGRDLGSPSFGYLTNVWVDGSAQKSDDDSGWAEGTHILPGQLKEPDWFEPLPEAPTRWRADIVNGAYFYIGTNLEVQKMYEGNPDIDGVFNRTQYDAANYFETREQAQAVAAAIKSLLEYVQTPIEGYESSGKPSPSKDYDDPNYINLADQARKAVQANNQ